MLGGLRVLEVSSFVAAPLGGMTLAQLGAEVIRVDPVGGGPDIGRWPLAESGTSLYWTGLNKGKRSVALDLRSEDGRHTVHRLAARCDAVLTNTAWLRYEPLAEARPDLIYVQIVGRSDGRPAVDYTVNAAMGFPLLTGPPSLAGPVNHVLPAWDVACGLYAAIAVLAADRRRARTGTGARLRVALEDVALATAGNLGFLAEAALGGERPRIGNHLFGGFARDFATADGRRVMVVALTERHFTDLVTLAGAGEAVAALERVLGADFGTDGDRYRHRETLASLIEPWFAARALAEVERELAGTSALHATYRSFGEVVAAPEAAANPMMSEIDQPGVGRVPAPGLPIGGGGGPAVPAPELGADTEDVLRELL